MIKFIFVGWVCEGNSDKIWASFESEGNYYCTWGRRGAKPSFKKHSNEYSLDKVKRSKEGRYKEVDQFMLFSVFPDFQEQVEETLFMSTLAGKVK